MVPSYHLSIKTPTPLVLGVGVMFAPVTCFVTFVLFGRRLSGNNLYRRVLTKRKKSSRPSGSAPTAPSTSPRAETSSGVSLPGPSSSSSSSLPLGGQGKQERSQGAPGVLSGGASSPPARSRSSARGGGASRLSSGASFSFGSGRSGSCPLAVDSLFPRLRLRCLSPILTAHSTT